MKNKNNKLFSRGTKIQTPDGVGTTINVNMRENTNDGPGVRQYVVRLDDGRIRHYSTNEVIELSKTRDYIK